MLPVGEQSEFSEFSFMHTFFVCARSPIAGERANRSDLVRLIQTDTEVDMRKLLTTAAIITLVSAGAAWAADLGAGGAANTGVGVGAGTTSGSVNSNTGATIGNSGSAGVGTSDSLRAGQGGVSDSTGAGAKAKAPGLGASGSAGSTLKGGADSQK
jgi:hypothetical protein